MEGDRKAYSEESRILITKQRQTIEKLKADNNNLAQDLKLLESRYNAKKMKGLQAKKAQELNEQAGTLFGLIISVIQKFTLRK